MVDNPRDQFEDFAQAGCQSITFHYEATGDQTEDAINEIRNLKMAVGLAIKPKTPVAAISKFLRQVDLVLVMTVEPGFGGQKLLPNCLEKVRDLSRLRTTNNYNFLIQVDGGINTETIQLASSSGSDVLVAGQAIYNGQPISQNVLQLQELMKHS
jgi:ribulose-phosphate 3-epimerase